MPNCKPYGLKYKKYGKCTVRYTLHMFRDLLSAFPKGLGWRQVELYVVYFFVKYLRYFKALVTSSVPYPWHFGVDPDPDLPDPHVFGLPGSGSISQRYGSGAGSGSFHHHAKIVRKTLIPTILWLFLAFIFEKWCMCTFKKVNDENSRIRIH